VGIIVGGTLTTVSVRSHTTLSWDPILRVLFPNKEITAPIAVDILLGMNTEESHSTAALS
jgi:hypothetical protein